MVSAIAFLTETAMLECVSVSSVNVSSWLELVELVSAPNGGVSEELAEKEVGYWWGCRMRR